MKKLTILLLTIFITLNLFSQSIPPKRELRGAWIATVTNIDWPSSTVPETQRQQLITLLNGLKAVNVNAIMFQIRPECDALYQSSIEPWSRWLTGSQGTAPSPFYDPLQFAIDEAHKRGMELHAWFNPYRAERSVGNYPLSPTHVINQHPDWVLQVGTVKFLNPGLQEVRDYVTSVFLDVALRYDVDGIHIDDYFYVEGITTQDAATFANYPRGFTNLGDWRRDNVNILIAQINDSLMAVKPWIKWGVSPRGIWRNGVPPGIVGNDNYSTIYCDAMAWLHNRSIDYINPQLYWAFGGGQDYAKLMPWWADSAGANNRHMYVGHAVYRIGSPFNATEVPRQIRLNRTDNYCQGSVLYNTTSTLANPLGFTDSLRNDLYRYPALLPIMNWKDIVPPNPIQNLRFERLASGQGGLLWDLPQPASDGDSAKRYVVYRFNNSNIQPSDLENSANILNVEGSRESIPGEPPSPSGPYYFVVTSLDRNYNESTMSNVLQVNPPPVPILAFPNNNAINIEDTVIVKWNYPSLAASYRLQIATDSTFVSGVLLNQNGITDTFKVITGLEGQSKYYWRVNSTNAGGTSGFSAVNNFTTGFPSTPILAYPLNNTGFIPVDTTLYWYPSLAAVSYDLMLARGADFASNTIVVDAQDILDTSFIVSGLQINTFHFWKIRANNTFGKSNWSAVWRFKTVNPTGLEDTELMPTEFALEQNYPNPFNPTTNFRFNISEAGLTTLKIYNLLGQEVAEVLNEFKTPGIYDVRFDASSLSSGIYFYRLRVNDYSASKKMILVK
ncbi:MAG: family 10 glycosylhydrolase [Ignavibacteriales bacterium]|nr:family 10 glycosylhydrolase [Ignavibacteriales bacterium]